jgi:YidC/Oxa1 family membrane protein insertase
MSAFIGQAWEIVILHPLINILVILSHYLFNNLGLSIILLTIIIRGAMYPMSRKQMLSTKKMQDLQPKLAEIQKKYAKDKQKLAQEQMALYKKSGMSPLGCVVPMLIQMPVWIALYQAIMRVLATKPEELLNLSRHLYSSWSQVFSLVPLNSKFLWIDLGVADPFFILPLLVGASMWVQQKMTTPNYTDPQQQSQGQIMLWMMPIMFTLLSISFPSGLALYWLVSNVISIAMQYFISGWGGMATMFKKNTNPPAKSSSGTPLPAKK